MSDADAKLVRLIVAASRARVILVKPNGKFLVLKTKTCRQNELSRSSRMGMFGAPSVGDTLPIVQADH